MALKVRIIATDGLSGTLKGIGTRVLRLGTQFIKFGAMAALAISGIAIKLASDLDIGLREIGTLMDGLTNKEMKNMTTELEHLAGKWGQTMSSLTKARYDIISSGFDTAAKSLVILNQTAILATAGVSDMATAGKLLTTALNAYGKGAKDAEHYSDVLFHTVKKGTTTIGDLGGSYGRILGIAASVGFGFEEVSAALATLTTSLGSTENATTALNGIFIGFLKSSEKLNKLMKKTEYGSVDAAVEVLGFADTLEYIKKTADAAGVKMKDLFDNIRGLMGILPLTTTQQKQYNEILKSYSDIAGTSSRAAAEVMKAFEKSKDRAIEYSKNMLRSLGRNLIEKLQPKIDAFNNKMEQMGELNWKRLSDILMNNWSEILLTLGKMALIGGEIIGLKLADAISKAIKNRFPNLSALFEGVGGELKKVIEGFIKAFNLGDVDTSGAVKKIQTIDEKIVELIQDLKNLDVHLITMINPAFDGATLTIRRFNDATNEVNLEPVNTQIEETIVKVQTLSEKFKKFWKSLKDEESDFLTNWAQINAAVENLHSSLLQAGTARIEEEMNKRIAAVLRSGLAEEEKESKIANIREQYHQKEIAWAKKLRAIKVAQSISNTALGVTRAFVDPGGVLGFILAGLIAAAGAAQIATIAASPYAQGGFVRMGGNIPSSDTIPAMLSPREIVSTAAATERFGNEIARLNQLAEGGFGSGGGGDKFYINAVDMRSFADAINRHPGRFAEMMQTVKSERYL